MGVLEHLAVLAESVVADLTEMVIFEMGTSARAGGLGRARA